MRAGLAGGGAGLSNTMRKARTGRAMFLTSCSPRSSKAIGKRSRIWSRTARLTLIPPGCAKLSIREAMSTPWP